MSNRPALSELKKAETLGDLAELLHYSASGLSYLVYKLPLEQKYRTFQLAKRDGQLRTISAPTEKLALLQQRLSDLLYECISEIKSAKPNFMIAAHGFIPGRDIVTNANRHKNKKYVFNTDLEDFFGTINFGRVRGYFIKDHSFGLSPKIATVIAQICCHKNVLPQGGPSSPVISNLVGNVLDARLLKVARAAGCSYSRYADDLTFSTNEQLFPSEIATLNDHGNWTTSSQLRDTILSCGFRLNEAKTRMAHRRTRQSVTGLTVNKKVNVNSAYYRKLRASFDSLFKKGFYFLDNPINASTHLKVLEGQISFVYYIKKRAGRTPITSKDKALQGPDLLYRKLLVYKYLVACDRPMIVTEGSSDAVYLAAALRKLGNHYPNLVELKDKKPIMKIKFLPTTQHTRSIIGINNGTSGQCSLIGSYSNLIKLHSFSAPKSPVIILCDNDSGATRVLETAAKYSSKPVSLSTTEPFYHLMSNLYLVKTPEGLTDPESKIEDLFSSKLLATELDGKKFNPSKEHGDHSSYAKTVFAEKVVSAKAEERDFQKFNLLLDRIDGCIEHFATTPMLT